MTIEQAEQSVGLWARNLTGRRVRGHAHGVKIVGVTGRDVVVVPAGHGHPIRIDPRHLVLWRGQNARLGLG